MRTIAIAAGILAMALAALLDLASTLGTSSTDELLLSYGVAALASLACLRATRSAEASRTRAAAGIGAVSLALTILIRLLADERHATWGVAETVSLLLLLQVVAHRLVRRGDAVALAIVALATVSGPWRLAGSDASSFALLLAVAVVTAVAVGLLRRSDHQRAAQTLLGARNDERRRIARDLHDDVAHHVGGIVVTAQAAQTVGVCDLATFASIERAGVTALESMRALVTILRDPDEDDGAARSADDWRAQLATQVERFGHTTGLSTSLTVSPDRVPAPYGQAVRRVVQEALTNVRRHALDATRTDVRVDVAENTLRVRVSDDGRTRPATVDPFRRAGGGFGLVGVSERAAAFGGTATAGPRRPRGWQVLVSLPLTAPDAPR